MPQHPPEVREEALRLYVEQGTTAASEATGVPKRTILKWASDDPAIARAQDKEKTAAATQASRLQRTWADFRANEALAAGAAANRMRQKMLEMVEESAPGRDVQSYTIAYGILIDKADQLNNQATQRIEVWAESELDRELRSLVTQMEDTIRERGPKP